MRLSAKPIVTWNGVNSYVFGNQWIINQGDPNTLYFQIFDADQATQGSSQTSPLFTGITSVGISAGLRYLVGIGGSNQPYQVSVTFPSIDDSKVLTLVATQADPNDSSIWKVSLTSDMSVSGGNLQFAVQEGSNIRRFSVVNMLNVQFPSSNGMC